MTPEKVAALQHLRKVLVRPVFILSMLGTIAGNVAQAQPTVGGWLAGCLAPAAWWACSEALLRVTDLSRGYMVALRIGAGSAAVGALATSYSHLLHFAQSVGWNDWTAYTFPLFLDVVALTMTAVLLGIQRALNTLPVRDMLAEQREQRKEQKANAGPAPDRGAGTPERVPNMAVIRQSGLDALVLLDAYGPNMLGWPTQRQIGTEREWSASKTNAAVKAARGLPQVVQEADAMPLPGKTA